MVQMHLRFFPEKYNPKAFIERSLKHENEPQQICQGTEANSRDAFVPPKPKEFDNAALIVISFEHVNGMNGSVNTGSGLMRFSVNGATPCNRTQQYRYLIITVNSIIGISIVQAGYNESYLVVLIQDGEYIRKEKQKQKTLLT